MVDWEMVEWDYGRLVDGQMVDGRQETGRILRWDYDHDTEHWENGSTELDTEMGFWEMGDGR